MKYKKDIWEIQAEQIEKRKKFSKTKSIRGTIGRSTKKFLTRSIDPIDIDDISESVSLKHADSDNIIQKERTDLETSRDTGKFRSISQRYDKHVKKSKKYVIVDTNEPENKGIINQNFVQSIQKNFVVENINMSSIRQQ